MNDYPLVFWICVAVLGWCTCAALRRWELSWAKPALAVLVTVGVWYPGNFLYDGIDHFFSNFSPEIVERSLWQVLIFLVAYWLLVHPIHRRFIAHIDSAVEHGNSGVLTMDLHHWFMVLLFAWLGLLLLGLSMVDWHVFAALFPIVAGYKMTIFAHGGIGGGASFLVASGGYLYNLVCAAFGVLFVTGSGRIRWISLLVIIISWPAIFMAHGRNLMLAVLMPGVMAYLFLSPARLLKKAIIAGIIFSFLNLWFMAVMTFRSTRDVGVFARFYEMTAETGEKRHLGLDMFSELCHANRLIESGEYRINYGRRYLDEITTAVPRTFWPEKPKLGWDYSVARGFGRSSGEGEGVMATIATGMIGQGVVNFGGFFGPVCSAFLMALWTGLLSRLWLQRGQVSRMILFMVGIALTFNLGRDITLLVLWPFVFGYLFVAGAERLGWRQRAKITARRRTPVERP